MRHLHRRHCILHERMRMMNGDDLVIISPAPLADAVLEGIRTSATTLRADCAHALERARCEALTHEPSSRAASVLGDIMDNAAIARTDDVPLCQDTGSVWVCLHAGTDAQIPGDVFSLVDEAVARAYEEGDLRMSIVRDALFDRANTKTNAPAFCEIRFTDEPVSRLSVMLKGGGSDNASRLVMLAPGEGREGVKRVVMEAVREKAANACPPLVVGVGVGATFDKVAGLSKQALLRHVGAPAESAAADAFERELLDEINALGIGPGALGGACTALAVHVKTAPCHIATLPVAVNLGCCAMRSAAFHLTEEGWMRDEEQSDREEGLAS